MKAIIVDDEYRVRGYLKKMLVKYCSMIEVVAEASNADDGAAAILLHKPDLVFLDIQMPGQSGFDMLGMLGEYGFDVIFVTGHDKYAIQAVNSSALYYILKPPSPADLIAAVAKAETKKDRNDSQTKLTNLLETVNNPNKREHKIIVTDMTGLQRIHPAELVHVEGDLNYSRFFLLNGKQVLATKGLSKFEKILEDYGFIRCHQSHMANINFIKALVKGSVVPELIMEGGATLPIAERRISDVRKILLNKEK